MIDLLYEDNHLLALNKPPGVLTQPSGTEQINLEDAGKVWLKEKYQKGGNVFLEAVHRIDKPVSGVVLFAKTSKALSRLQASIRQDETEKRYYAIVEGEPLEPMGLVKHWLVHDHFKATVAMELTPKAKLAKLYYHLIKKMHGFTLLEVNLITGRYHQIRIQLSAMGCPILGDHKYGGKKEFYSGVIALHHYQLQIPHPITKERIVMEAPFPKTWPISVSYR